MYKTFTENIDKKVPLKAKNGETVQTVQFSIATYINRYTHIRTPLLTNFLVINIYLYTIIELFSNISFKKNVQIVQNGLFELIRALFFGKTFVQTVITFSPPF